MACKVEEGPAGHSMQAAGLLQRPMVTLCAPELRYRLDAECGHSADSKDK